MITNKKIEELYESTPDYVGVGFGFKLINKEYTEEHAIIFTVDKKRPIEEIPEDELLPSEIEINGVTYKTDVVEIGKIGLLACDSATLTNCYDWREPFTYNGVQYGLNIPPGNRGFIRPLKGGISTISQNQSGYVGTLGFIAVDNAKNALVGVTNNHVVVGNAFYTALRNASPVNEYQDNVYQPSPWETNPPGIAYTIGEVVRYVPIQTCSYNQVDGALITVAASSISNTESFKQYGLFYNNPMPFATTAEIDGMVIPGSPYYNPPIYSSGRTSGVKFGGLCGLRVFTINQIEPIGSSGPPSSGYNLDGIATPVTFSRLIGFTRTSADCPFPIQGGDSGSALIANFNGVYKIIGLVFAGSTYFGYACRIDEVASQLNISAWDGTTKNYFNTGSRQFRTTPGSNANKTINCNDNIYWQVGTISNTNPCN
jgi:hypothetical protein